MRRRTKSSLFRRALSGIIVLAVTYAHAHSQSDLKAGRLLSDPPPAVPAPISAPVSALVGASATVPLDLPDSPGTVLRHRVQSVEVLAETALMSDAAVIPGQAVAPQQPGRSLSLTGAEAKASDQAHKGGCVGANENAGKGIVEVKANPPELGNYMAGSSPGMAARTIRTPPPCPPAQVQNPYQRFLNSATPIPLTPRQKGYLALHNFIEPGNIVTILGTSGIAIASDSHSAYGPGWRGFGKNAGISFVQDATGDFFGTFLIPAAAHEDPHYHRMPNAGIPRRILHAVSRTVIAQSDYGRPMPNFSTLLTYPITAEIANLYVPGVATNGRSTVERVLTGYATDPIDNLITEFLPDVAKRIHVRVIFVQQIINQVAAGQPVSMF